MTVSLHNRRKLEEAIARLIDGTVTAPDANLTWKNVAAVAGVSKATADRAADLRENFRRQLEERMPAVPARARVGSRPPSEVDEEIARLRRETTELKEATKVLHSVILTLVHENQRLARRRQRDDAGALANNPTPTGNR